MGKTTQPKRPMGFMTTVAIVREVISSAQLLCNFLYCREWQTRRSTVDVSKETALTPSPSGRGVG
jgi:hypothetical protein